MKNKKSVEILIDFDGTVVTHEFPRIGKDVGAVPVLKKLVEAGHKLILFTMRSDVDEPKSDDPSIHAVGGDYLTQAVNWFKENDIPLYGIQTNPTQHTWTKSPKAYGQLIIDDTCLGIPMIYPSQFSNVRPYVDWDGVHKLLIKRGLLTGNIEEDNSVKNKEGYNLFLDDERNPESLEILLPKVLFNMAMGLNWVVVKNYREFVNIIENRGLPNIMSLDHDLGYWENDIEYDLTEKTGMDCVKYLVEYCMEHDLDVPLYMIHSRNETGANNMDSYLSNYKEFRKDNKKSED